MERDQRQTFRVTVKPNSGVTAHLCLAGRKLAATVGDLSPEGMFVKLERGLLPILKIGSTIDVEVRFDDERFDIQGTIRSQHTGGYGIHFPERDQEGRINPRDRLGKISAYLQRTDLSQRLKILKLPD
jgi:PilZ domain